MMNGRILVPYGAAPMHPITNNGVESANRYIRKSIHLESLMPLGLLIEKFLTMVRDWSI